MRSILVTIVVAVLPATSALAEPAGRHKPDRHPSSGRVLSPKGGGTVNSCAEFGPGFVKVEGTDTCMRVGGGISIGAGGSSGWR